MRKKLFIVLFSLFIFSILLNNVVAADKTGCSYKSDSGDKKATFKFDYDSRGLTVGQVSITGMDSKPYIQNWYQGDFANKTNFSGSKYYQENSACPPHMMLVEAKKLFGNLYQVYLYDDASLSSIEATVRDKYNVKGVLYFSRIETTVEPPEEKPTPSSCLDFTSDGKRGTGAYEGTCEKNAYFSCVWVGEDDNGYCNTDSLQYVKCGTTYDIPRQAPEIISFVINFFKIAAPILLVLFSIVALVKAIASSNEDEMVKARKNLIKKLIYSLIVFFVIQIVQFVMLKVADTDEEKKDLSKCFSCFLNNDCEKISYYKTNLMGINICTYIDGSPMYDGCDGSNLTDDATHGGGGGTIPGDSTSNTGSSGEGYTGGGKF